MYRFAIRLEVAVVSLLALVALGGCGTDEAKTDDDVAASDSASQDVVDASKTDTAAQDTAVGTDTSTDTGAKTDTADAVVAPPTCGEALHCALKCPVADKACKDACAKDLVAADVSKLKAVGDCHVELCGAVTEGAVAELNCDFDKCYDTIDACAGFGAGESSCDAAFVCVGACENGDAACKLACSVAAGNTSKAQVRKLRVCSDANCSAKLDPIARAACIAKGCAPEVEACLAGAAYNCVRATACFSHCPDSLPNKPNTCGSACISLAGGGAATAFGALSVCREQCNQVTNPVGCWAEKCQPELAGCFGSGGTETCQDIDNCVSDDCDGVGGTFACIETCLDKGKPASKDAFIQYEGCMAKNMDSKEAKIAGCSFPYDQATCLPPIKGQFCGNQSQNCFTDK